MIVVQGAGYVVNKKHGSVARGQCTDHDSARSLYTHLLEKQILSSPIKNFGRFDTAARIGCFTAALALDDAGISYSENENLDMGVLGTSVEGSLRPNIEYFKDYVDCGRTLARGNLFIYTLPSSPLAEASIYFGLQGPLLYMMFPGRAVENILRNAAGMITNSETSAMLAFYTDESEGICFALTDEQNTASGRICTVDDAVERIGELSRVVDIVNALTKAPSFYNKI
jgi:hypothetical protein